MRERLAALYANFWRNLRQRWGGVLVAVLLPTLSGVLLLHLIAGQKLIHWSYDSPFLMRGSKIPDDVVMVYLDEASHTVMERPYDQMWPRELHAQLVDRLTKEKAKAVVFDILFLDPGPDPEVDRRFAKAIQDNGKVVLCADLVPIGYGDNLKIDAPLDVFYKAASERIGFDTTFPDGDGIIRKYLPVKTNLAQGISSEGWLTAELAGGIMPRDDKFKSNPFYLNYYGPSGTIPEVSYFKTVTDDPAVPPGFFHNKVVFIGGKTQTQSWNERRDQYPTPFSSISLNMPFSPGAEIHATAFLNLLRGEWLNRFPLAVETWITALLGISCGLLLVMCRPIQATLLAIALAIFVASINYFLFTQKYSWFPWLIPVLIQIPLALIWSITFNSVQLYVQNRLLEQSLGKHLSPKRVKQLRSKPEFLEPGAEKQRLTILFSDIENFTTISEGMDSDELAKLMNRYFENAVTGCIHKTDGFVVKYIGDAIFSFWNAPEEQKSHESLACEAALLLRKQNLPYTKDGHSHFLRTRIGLHTGEANVGNFGSATRIDYTAIGENINLASRLEGLNKFLGTDVLITAEVKNGTGDKFVTRPVGRFRLKGFERAVEVHELVGTADEAADSKVWREAFKNALNLFEQKHFLQAKDAFSHVQQLRNDGPSRFYLRYLEEIASESLPSNWHGEVDLKEK